MMKKAIISGIVICSILLVGCNKTEVLESEQVVEVSQEKKLFSELKNEIIESITEQTELEGDSLVIMIDGGAGELSVSVGFPKDAKTESKLVQQIVEDSIKKLSETKTTSEEKIKMKIKTTIEKY